MPGILRSAKYPYRDLQRMFLSLGEVEFRLAEPEDEEDLDWLVVEG